MRLSPTDNTQMKKKKKTQALAYMISLLSLYLVPTLTSLS